MTNVFAHFYMLQLFVIYCEVDSQCLTSIWPQPHAPLFIHVLPSTFWSLDGQELMVTFTYHKRSKYGHIPSVAAPIRHGVICCQSHDEMCTYLNFGERHAHCPQLVEMILYVLQAGEIRSHFVHPQHM